MDLTVLLLLLLSIKIATSRDTITPSHPLNEPETLSSSNGMYHLGFFTPTNYSYLGIWYMSNPPIVWVANREQPIKNSSSAVLQISQDGNLVIMDNTNKNGILVWSTNLSNISSNTTAQLLNTGNLVLQENTTGSILWQSFQHPTNTLLQNMQLSTNKFTGKKVKLTSWRTPQDPSLGEFSLSLERLSIPEEFVWKGAQPYWRSGPWNGVTFLGIPGNNINNLDGFYLDRSYDNNGTYYLSFNFANQSLLLICVLTDDGNIKDYYWDYVKKNWSIAWIAINSDCDLYGKCGAFGICDRTSEPICSCLPGFEPKNATEWNSQNWSSGCVRKKALQCEDNGFVMLENSKTADFAVWSSPTDYDCRTQCIRNCSCEAYAYDAGIGCMLWAGNLIDIQRFSTGGTDLYIRVPNSDSGKKKNNVTVIVAVTVGVGVIVLVSCIFILWKRTSRKDVDRANSESQGRVQKNELLELSQFEFERLAIATNNFHLSNKLGQGGFGPVYKGTLEDGQEIAVKRLSRASGQGQEEFMNEVLVISKLQHRNLVRLLGCCIERDEKILIYEYMPNRSLDAYMFDPSKQVLSWEKRFAIIEGIARGLLYLHRDSRLRIIHRDLKLSNILLDGELNAKISDFGMAKIFGHTEDEANTRRVVGTFGYMSPEYVMEGLFSEKSDVFSFGVLILEIVSKRKNASFYEDAESLSLIGFAWKLWNDDMITALIDAEIRNVSSVADIMRCIHIGLLCVQELARDRPTMTAVISMLNSETVNLPPPKQPAFMHRQSMLDTDSSSHRTRSDGSYSINYLSLTNMQGR
ncbi:hypothetical protein PIB30_010236 [Stylosanthes scabra]|uniref:Receptor-like serine/threonine-protein kinase n=1 Tax=Stylosanthes scabra TaxID=79078 RepID=A0ABU6S6R1_9FABA|nr:hypothetical protein [Stylosanthes scabra]